jgi:hypothetical protein
MSKEQCPKISQVDVNDVPKQHTFIHEGVLYVNSKMMPPPGSQPLDASKIIITTQPEYNALEAGVLMINYPNAAATADYSVE